MTLLLLAGTAQARAIAAALAGQDVIASLAGVTRDPAPLGVPTRHGGFGGDAGFAAYLDAASIHAVLDATHPFAARITQRTAAICAAHARPYCQVLRPPFVPGPGDRWRMIAHPADAAALVPPGACVFLATGRQSLPDFAGLAGRRVICRVIDAPAAAFPFAGGAFLVGRPPFSVAQETALFRRLGVDWLVVKDAGGAASAPKLVAARALGIPVLLLARPPAGDWPCVDTVAAALDWARKVTSCA